jgi:hypothetical protein
MKRTFAMLLALTMILGAAAWASNSSVTGYISDDKCGAKGANAGAEACTKKCIEGGAKPVMVSDADQSVLAIDNPDAVKGHEGHHVTITGTVDTTKKSVHVASVKMAPAPAPASKH